MSEALLYDPPKRRKAQPPDGPLIEAAGEVVAKLREAGHEAYLVGGSIRDLVMRQKPSDYDIASSALPEEVQKLFRKTVPVGIEFGTVMVLWGGFSFEVTTFRADGRYVDGRRPEEVTFASVKEDVERRDFTINGLLYEPDTEQVLDYVGGLEDIERGLLRTIGDPFARFGEDRLRMLRAVRFTSRYHFDLEPETLSAIRQMAARIEEVSVERIQQELAKIMKGIFLRLGVELLREVGLMEHVMPVLMDDRTLLVRMALLEQYVTRSEALSWAVLLASCTPAAGEEVMRELRFSSQLCKQVHALLGGLEELGHFLERKVPAQKRLLRQEFASDLLVLGRIVAQAQRRSLNTVVAASRALEKWGKEALWPPRWVTGNELKQLGYRPGPQFKKILTALEDAQLNDEVTSEAQALQWLQEHFPRA